MRSVYADALHAAGDPRGELIALQLAGSTSPRVDELLADHWQRWLGVIGACVDRGGVRFERGFPHAVEIIHPPQHLSRLTWHRIQRAPEWSTVASVRLAGAMLVWTHPGTMEDLLRHAPLRSLERLGAPHAILQRSGPPPRALHHPLHTLELLLFAEPFALDLACVRGGTLECTRTGAHDADPLELAIWDAARAADIARLVIRPASIRELSTQLAAVLATDRERPAELEYIFHGHRIRARDNALDIFLDVVHPSTVEPSARDIVRWYAPALARTPRARLVDLRTSTLDRDGTGDDLLRWLHAR